MACQARHHWALPSWGQWFGALQPRCVGCCQEAPLLVTLCLYLLGEDHLSHSLVLHDVPSSGSAHCDLWPRCCKGYNNANPPACSGESHNAPNTCFEAHNHNIPNNEAHFVESVMVATRRFPPTTAFVMENQQCYEKQFLSF